MAKAAGGKITASHSTLIEAAVRVVAAARKQPEVSKISLGMIKSNIGIAPPRLIFRPMTGGLLVKVRGNNSIQDIRVYTSDPVSTQLALLQKF